MTEPHHDPSLDDLEAVSAHLDGEATAAEVARIEGDPSLRALATRMGAVRERLAVDEPAGSILDAHVAAALAAFDAGPATAPVVSLSAVRERRWYHRVPLGAVAAVLVVVALFGALTQIDTGDDDSAETAADSGGDDSGGDDADDSGTDTASEETMAADALEDAADEAGDGAFSAGAGGSSPPLQFATVDELADHLTLELLAARNRSAEDDAAATTSAPAPGGSPELDEQVGCDPVAVAGIEGAPLVAVVPAVVDGRTVTAVVVEAGDGRRLLVVDDTTCTVADDRLLAG